MFDKDAIKTSLSLEEVAQFVYELGGEPEIKGNYFAAKTICHGGHSHKLYYYNNTHLFRCFTDCGESFDIFQLIQKMNGLVGGDTSLPTAVRYVASYFGIAITDSDFDLESDALVRPDWDYFNQARTLKKKEKALVVNNHALPVFDDAILQGYPYAKITAWELEGIPYKILQYNNIRYDPITHGVIIPHYDIDNNLIGIRERTLIKEQEKNGKYRPAYLNNKLYNHPLSLNVYNLNNSKEIIKQMKQVILFEGEKSPMKFQTMFSTQNDISGATCGSALIRPQVELLLSLGVKEIVIGYDRQYQKIGDSDYLKYMQNLHKIHQRYGGLVKISFLFDKKNMLDFKSSPIDHGKDTFLYLYKNRINFY